MYVTGAYEPKSHAPDTYTTFRVTKINTKNTNLAVILTIHNGLWTAIDCYADEKLICAFSRNIT